VSQTELLRDVVALLNKAGIPYMVVGSYASSFYGEPRMTRDIDIVVDPAEDALRALDELVDRDRSRAFPFSLRRPRMSRYQSWKGPQHRAQIDKSMTSRRSF